MLSFCVNCIPYRYLWIQERRVVFSRLCSLMREGRVDNKKPLLPKFSRGRTSLRRCWIFWISYANIRLLFVGLESFVHRRLHAKSFCPPTQSGWTCAKIRITKDGKSPTHGIAWLTFSYDKRRREKTFPHCFRPCQTQTWVCIDTWDRQRFWEIIHTIFWC